MQERAGEAGSPRAAATRRRIVEAAACRMAIDGYARTSLDAIVEDCGISKGNLYHHFASKEDLGYSVLDHLESEVHEAIARRMQTAHDPLERIEAVLDALARQQTASDCRGGCPLGNLAAELSDQHEGFRNRLAAIFALWCATVAVELARLQHRAGRTRSDLEGIARYLVAALEGSILMSKVTRDYGEVENAIVHLKRYVRQQLTA